MATEHTEIANELIDEVVLQENEKDSFDDSFKEEETNPLDDINNKNDELLTHNRIQNHICGDIIELEKGYSKVSLLTTELMTSDDLGLIHSGFIFGAADYAAAIAVNEQNTVIIASRLKFLAPAKLNDTIIFEAKAKFEDSKKREIKVIGVINEIKVFDGIFQAVILEKHILKLKLNHI